MRRFLTALLLSGSLCIAEGQEDHVQFLPRPDMVGDWAMITKAFQSWKVNQFHSWGSVADGGSIAFGFTTDTGVKFDVLVANRSWWSPKDAKENRQPIYLTIAGGNGGGFKAYRVEKNSDEEKQLLLILTLAAASLEGEGQAGPVHIKALIGKIRDRIPPDADWPLSREEVERSRKPHQQGGAVQPTAAPESKTPND